MDFIYEARTIENDIRRGNMSAESAREAVRLLQTQGLFVLRLVPASGGWFRLRRFFQHSHPKFSMVFFRQLSVMLKTGLSLNEALTALYRQAGPSEEKTLLSDICHTVQSGGTMEQAMRVHPDWFPSSAAAIVHAGEASGTLDILLEKLAKGLRKQYVMKEKRMTLLAYPAILLLTSFFAAAFLLAFVFPIFTQFFAEMHTALPLPTRIVLGVYDFAMQYGFLLLAGMLLLAVEGIRRYQEERTRRKIDYMLLRIPLIGKLIFEQELSKIAGTIAVLLESGIVLNEVMYITAGVTENAYLRMVLERAGHDVEKGFSVSASLEKAKIFPMMFMSQFQTGETTGAMTEMLAGTEIYYEEESSELAQRLQTLIEPCMVIVAGCVIGTLVFAIALPVLDMMTSFSG